MEARMKQLLEFLRREPAMVVAVVLAVVNTFATINAEQALHVQTIVESVIVLLAGGVVRQSVYSPATVDAMKRDGVLK